MGDLPAIHRTILYAIAAARRPDSGLATTMWMSRIDNLCHSGVSLAAFAPRIETVRRMFILSSALVAALTVACSATPVAAAASASTGSLTATSQHARGDSHRTTAHTLRAAVTPGSSPSLLQNQPGLSEQLALQHAGSSNPNVTSPADPSIAIGPSNIVEVANSAMEVTTRSGATPTFMNLSAMVGNTSGFSLRYPHVVYDPASGRFILMVLQYNPSLSGCVSQVEVMLSQANPALPWITRGQINIDPEIGGGVELSTVSLAITGSLLVETSDYQSCITGLPVASQMEVIRRADFISGAFNSNSDAFVEPGPIGLQPAQAWTAQTVAYAVANDANCSGKVPGSIAVFAIDGLPAAGAVSVTCTNWTEATATSTPPAAAQSGTTATLTTGTDRFLSAVWQGNVIWVAGNTGCTPSGDSQLRSCVNVVSIPATSTGSVSAPTQLPVKSVSGAYLYDPALAVDGAGNAILTLNKSSSSALESMMVAAITGGVWSTLTTLHPSSTFYQPAACTTCTWGDYSAAVQDPERPTDVWVVSEENDGNNTVPYCATANTCWNTYIGRYTFAGPVIASLSPAAGPASGGELVTVAGYDFGTDGTLTFTFNGAPLLPTTGSLTPDAFTFTTPPGSSELVEAQVHELAGHESDHRRLRLHLRGPGQLPPDPALSNPGHQADELRAVRAGSDVRSRHDQEGAAHRALVRRGDSQQLDSGGPQRDRGRGQRQQPPHRVPVWDGAPTSVEPQLRRRQGDRQPGDGDARAGRSDRHLQRLRDGQRPGRRRGILRAGTVEHRDRRVPPDLAGPGVRYEEHVADACMQGPRRPRPRRRDARQRHRDRDRF